MSCDRDALAAAEQALIDALGGPKSHSNASGTYVQRDIKDYVEAIKHYKLQCAARNRRRGIAFTQLKPPGAV